MVSVLLGVASAAKVTRQITDLVDEDVPNCRWIKTHFAHDMFVAAPGRGLAFGAFITSRPLIVA